MGIKFIFITTIVIGSVVVLTKLSSQLKEEKERKVSEYLESVKDISESLQRQKEQVIIDYTFGFIDEDTFIKNLEDILDRINSLLNGRKEIEAQFKLFA